MLAISTILTRLGHAVETIKQDYGKDLLVQTQRARMLDPLQFWVQSKGTRDPGLRSYSFTDSQMMLWSHTADPVLIVLWDVDTDTGLYHVVAPHSARFDGGRNTIRFNEEHVLNAQAAERLIWEFRFKHEARELLWGATVMDPTRQNCVNYLIRSFFLLHTMVYTAACRPELGKASNELNDAAALTMSVVNSGLDALKVDDRHLLHAARTTVAEIARISEARRFAVSNPILDAMEAVWSVIPGELDTAAEEVRRKAGGLVAGSPQPFT